MYVYVYLLSIQKNAEVILLVTPGHPLLSLLTS